MFNLFKKYNGKISLKNWNIHVGTGFEIINNLDSIQYVNKDASKVMYFSILEIKGNSLVTNDVFSEEPKIVEDANGWQLKGMKKAPSQILVCVISFKNLDDAKWARESFDSIKYNNIK